MERNGMYENTPWERIAEYGLWVGLGTLVFALIVWFLLKRFSSPRSAENFFGSGIPAAKAAVVLGAVFNIWWVEAHANYPYPFGRIMLGIACGIALVALIIGFIKRSWLPAASRYAALLVPVAAAIYMSATSTSIIAEGQVTAMVLPYVWVIALVLVCALAPLIKNAAMRLTQDYETVAYIATMALLGILVYFINDKLPVVQFHQHPDDRVYPVMGPSYAAFAGAFATAFFAKNRAGLAAKIMGVALIVAAIFIAFTFQHIYGIAIAAAGAALWWTADYALRQDFLYY